MPLTLCEVQPSCRLRLPETIAITMVTISIQVDVGKSYALRKQRPIQAVIERHCLFVSNFSKKKLVEILQYLLKEWVFESNLAARTAFPELFSPPPPLPRPAPEVKASNPPTQQSSIIEEFLDLLEKYLRLTFSL